MELFVSTTASSRATAPLSLAPLRLGGHPSAVAPHRRRLPARGWRCASVRPRPSDESAFESPSAVVVTDKPDSPADEKGGEEPSAAPSASADAAAEAPSGSAEAAAAAPVSTSEPSGDDGGAGLDDILSKLDIEVTPTLILTGSSAFLALWILSSVVSAIDSVPLLPKLLEVIGIGYSIWFTSRNLIFKESRDELFAKFEDLKQRII